MSRSIGAKLEGMPISGGYAMRIETEDYRIAPLTAEEEAVEVIREAEEIIAGLTGNKVTLIAYEKKDELE